MQHKNILQTYLPDASVDVVFDWIRRYNIHLKISKGRKTKLGDYRPPIRHSHHRISINHDLNPYAFLITFVHELAHLKVFEAYGTGVSPHGRQWKTIYRELMLPLLDMDIFPEDLSHALHHSIVNAKAASGSDLQLTRILNQYDEVDSQKTRLEDLAEAAIFRIQNGRIFRKGEKQRTRYKCMNLTNKKWYLFHPLTPVIEELTEHTGK